MNNLTYAQYKLSDVWKCKHSPTSAHHWVETDVQRGLFRCKYCSSLRRFLLNSSGAPMSHGKVVEYPPRKHKV
jgi:hypothetical protein